MRRLTTCLWLFLGFIPLAANAQSVVARQQMVVAAHPLAAAAGLEMLRKGGSAIDAAVAVQAVLTLVEPQSSGIGGGALIMHFNAARHEVAAWDGRETAPAGATPNLFLRPDGTPMDFYEAVLSGRSVGVPGAIAALESAHRVEGKLPWAALFEPAITLAEQGFPVSPRLAETIAGDAERLKQSPEAAAYFFLPDGKPLPAGHQLRNPALATVLRAIAADGARAIQQGPIAEDMLKAIRAHGPDGGSMTAADLAGYQAKRRDPVCTLYRAYRVCGFGPPSSGGVTVAQILGILEHQNMARLDPRGAEAAYLFAEAARIAFADRAEYLADSDFVPVPVRGLTNPGYLALRAQLLDRRRADPAPRAGNPSWREGRRFAPQPEQAEYGTSHISIRDAAGNAVSMTTTVESAFGSRLMVRGFMLNNELTDFSFRPELDGMPVANRVEGGKRPRSSMSPSLVFNADGSLFAVVGSPGGGQIISFVAQTLIGLLDWKMDPQSAIDLPRLTTQGSMVDLEENTTAADLAAALEAKGLKIRLRPSISGLQAIVVSPAGLLGGSDGRREGVAVGD
ncbi:gamma-glutamyltransferase [Acetobacteraceae bacterium H6797]|nr:gamma-glutamyltransferase [Acetobacteraceae bacterium H6797]